MKNHRLLLSGLFLMLLYPPLSSASVTIGDRAPDFSLEDPLGQTHFLSDYMGKYVVLEWINHGCPFVKKHYKDGHMQKLQKAFTEDDVIWLSINSGAPGKQGHWTPEKAIAETEAHNAHPTAILLDSDGSVGRLYDARTTPHMFLINPEGVLIYQGAIDSIPSADPADVPKATNYIQKAFDEASSGQSVSEPQTRPYGCSVKYGPE